MGSAPRDCASANAPSYTFRGSAQAKLRAKRNVYGRPKNQPMLKERTSPLQRESVWEEECCSNVRDLPKHVVYKHMRSLDTVSRTPFFSEDSEG
jgi:hypothetical protein